MNGGSGNRRSDSATMTGGRANVRQDISLLLIETEEAGALLIERHLVQ
jgi:hypothetical protein